MSKEEIEEALISMRAEEKSYKKGNRILRAGTILKKFGMILEGNVTIESNDIWGRRTILSYADEGVLFGESYALCKDKAIMVDVVANTDCTVCFFGVQEILSQSIGAKAWALKFMVNLLEITAEKNLILSLKSFHTSPKTIRERVLAYLNSVAVQKGEHVFAIPFDRQQLADYLNVERSALSKELGKMQEERLIEFSKNRFLILREARSQ